MKTTISNEACIGCGLCPSLASDLYKMDDDKAVVIKLEDLSDQELIDAKEAETSCPVDAISVA